MSAPAALFGPGWLVIPGSTCGVHQSDLKPCSCGGVVFVVTLLDQKACGDVRIACRACLPPKAHAVVLGEIDVSTRKLRLVANARTILETFHRSRDDARDDGPVDE